MAIFIIHVLQLPFDAFEQINVLDMAHTKNTHIDYRYGKELKDELLLSQVPSLGFQILK
jgi:hypothetical protein